jgi:chromate transporter
LSISQVTPGPVAINTSTYVGYKMAGILGSGVATIAVVLVCFILSVLLAGRMYRYRDHPVIKSVFGALRPVVIALILSAAVTTGQTIQWDWRALVIGILAAFMLLKIQVKMPVVMIISGALGAAFYGFYG